MLGPLARWREEQGQNQRSGSLFKVLSGKVNVNDQLTRSLTSSINLNLLEFHLFLIGIRHYDITFHLKCKMSCLLWRKPPIQFLHNSTGALSQPCQWTSFLLRPCHGLRKISRYVNITHCEVWMIVTGLQYICSVISATPPTSLSWLWKLSSRTRRPSSHISTFLTKSNIKHQTGEM